jgi:predicted Zn-dependent protease
MRNISLIAVLGLAGVLMLAGCSGGGGDQGGAGGIGGSGVSLGSLIGGKAGQYTDAGLKAGSAITLSEEQEDEMGRTVAIAATNRWPLYDNPELTKYVTLVGLTLASVSARPDGNWVFGVLDTPQVGAYSGPNGYIMVTRGALAIMEDESELAGVLAHEMAHSINRHGMEVVKKARFAEAGIEAGSVASKEVALFNKALDFAVKTILDVGWNQGQETQADSEAVRLLRDAGYDPGGLPRFLARMQQKGGAGGARPLGTHPGTADRIARTNSQIGAARGGATNRERFAKFAAQAKL